MSVEIRLVVANLQRRPMRSLVSILAVAIEVALILLIVGLTNGIVSDNQKRIGGMNADIVVRAGNASMFLALSGNTLPLALQPLLDAQPDVKAAAPVALQVLSGGIDTTGGIDLPSFDAVAGGFNYLQGGPFRAPMDVLVDNLYAAQHHIHAGAQLNLLGHAFTVRGIVEHGKGARLYIPLTTLDQLAGTPGKAAVFYIKLYNPAQTNAVVSALEKLLPGYTVQPLAQYLELFTASNIPELPLFQAVMIGIAVTIGLLVIFLSMYATILERTREIGILKSLGASRPYIMRLVLRETLAMAILGAIAGVLLAVVVRAILADTHPTLAIELQPAWIGRGVLIALVGSVVGGLYPALKAAGEDAIAALAYE